MNPKENLFKLINKYVFNTKNVRKLLPKQENFNIIDKQLSEMSKLIEINEAKRVIKEQFQIKQPNFLDNANTSNSFDKIDFKHILAVLNDHLIKDTLKKKIKNEKILDNIPESKLITSTEFNDILKFIRNSEEKIREKSIVQKKIKNLKILDNNDQSNTVSRVLLNQEEVLIRIKNPSSSEKVIINEKSEFTHIKDLILGDDSNAEHEKKSNKDRTSSLNSYVPNEEEKEKSYQRRDSKFVDFSVDDIQLDEGNQTNSAHYVEVTNFAANDNDLNHQNISIIEDYDASKSDSKLKKTGTFEEKSILNILEEKKERDPISEEENINFRLKKNLTREKSENYQSTVEKPFISKKVRRTLSTIQQIAIDDDYVNKFTQNSSNLKKKTGTNIKIAKEATQNLTNMEVRMTRSDLKNQVVKSLNFDVPENNNTFENKSNSLDSKKQQIEKIKINKANPITPSFQKQNPFSNLFFDTFDLEKLEMKIVSPQKPLPKQNFVEKSNIINL